MIMRNKETYLRKFPDEGLIARVVYISGKLKIHNPLKLWYYEVKETFHRILTTAHAVNAA